jgi:uncharacterized membrane protein
MRVQDVPFSAGFTWIREAFDLFRAQPLGWISLLSAWALFSVLLTVVPFIGLPLMFILQPGLFAGFVLACRDQEMGKPVTIAHLFAGFQLAGRPLIQVGAIALFATTLLQIGLHYSGIFDSVKPTQDMKEMVETMQAAIRANMPIWLGAMLLQAVINGALWFTAALIAHQPMPATHAVRWSLFAFVGNFMPLFLFGVLLIALVMLAILPMGLGLLIYLPIYAIAHYTSFKSVFRADVAESSNDAPPANDAGGDA